MQLTRHVNLCSKWQTTASHLLADCLCWILESFCDQTAHSKERLWRLTAIDPAHTQKQVPVACAYTHQSALAGAQLLHWKTPSLHGKPRRDLRRDSGQQAKHRFAKAASSCWAAHGPCCCMMASAQLHADILLPT